MPLYHKHPNSKNTHMVNRKLFSSRLFLWSISVYYLPTPSRLYLYLPICKPWDLNVVIRIRFAIFVCVYMTAKLTKILYNVVSKAVGKILILLWYYTRGFFSRHYP